MQTFILTDYYGNAWGTIAAQDESEAVELLLDDVEERPEAYLGQPEQIIVNRVH